jgi:hypothetical protein
MNIYNSLQLLIAKKKTYTFSSAETIRLIFNVTLPQLIVMPSLE